MDIFSGLDIEDDAVWFDLPNLKTGGVWKNPFNNETIQFRIKSPDSPEMRAFEAKVQQSLTNAVLSGRRRQQNVIDVDEQEDVATQRALLATVGWKNLPDPKGAEVPYSAETAKAILTDPKRRWMRDWVASMVTDRGNFFGDTAPAGGTPPAPKK